MFLEGAIEGPNSEQIAQRRESGGLLVTPNLQVDKVLPASWQMKLASND